MKSPITAWLILVCLSASSLLVTAHAKDPYAGKYERLTSTQPTDNPNKVEVVEFFWYGCPHCYYLDEHVQSWLKTKPDYVDFKHIPAVYSKAGRWTPGAKAYYTAEALDILDKIHTPFFKAIHEKRRGALRKNEQAIQRFFAKSGVSKDQFTNTYHSFGVDTAIGKAINMTERYGIRGVPTIFVNGKYRLNSQIAGGYVNLIKVLNYLIEKEYKLMLANPQASDVPSTP
jgi:thiol:disulfide interchange protein DsbA